MPLSEVRWSGDVAVAIGIANANVSKMQPILDRIRRHVRIEPSIGFLKERLARLRLVGVNLLGNLPRDEGVDFRFDAGAGLVGNLDLWQGQRLPVALVAFLASQPLVHDAAALAGELRRSRRKPPIKARHLATQEGVDALLHVVGGVFIHGEQEVAQNLLGVTRTAGMEC